MLLEVRLCLIAQSVVMDAPRADDWEYDGAAEVRPTPAVGSE